MQLVSSAVLQQLNLDWKVQVADGHPLYRVPRSLQKHLHRDVVPQMMCFPADLGVQRENSRSNASAVCLISINNHCLSPSLSSQPCGFPYAVRVPLSHHITSHHCRLADATIVCVMRCVKAENSLLGSDVCEIEIEKASDRWRACESIERGRRFVG